MLTALCLVAAVIDGDTLRCADGLRLRLAGIDAPELHCSARQRYTGKDCDARSAQRARQALARLTPPGSLVRWQRIDASPCQPGFQVRDPYGRTVAIVVNGSGQDASAAQLADGQARRWVWRCR